MNLTRGANLGKSVKDDNGNRLQIPVTFWRDGRFTFVHGYNDVRQTETHTSEPLLCEPTSLLVEIAIEKLKRYKSSGIDQTPAKLIQSGGNMLHSKIFKLNSVWNKEELPQ